MAQAQTAGFGFVAFSVLLQFVIYCLIAFVIWRFYQMVSRIAEDIAAIKAALQRRRGDPGFDLELPPDPLG